MKPPKQSSPLVIKNVAQAAVFDNAAQSSLLTACIRDEQSLSQLQRRFGMSLSKLHYHVNKLLSLELLMVSRVEQRGGRPIRYYRAVTETFLVSQTLLAHPPSDRWAREFRLAMKDAYSEVEDLAFRFGASQDGGLAVQGVSASAKSKPARVQDISGVLCLTATQRASLAEEMMDLYNRYMRAAAGRSSESFFVQLAFAPMPEAEARRALTKGRE